MEPGDARTEPAAGSSLPADRSTDAVGRPPHRLAAIVVGWLGVLLAACAIYWPVAADDAVFRGRRRYAYRESLKHQLERTVAERPEVLWMGDSTILGLRADSYPQIVKGGLPEISSGVIGFFGCDYFTYYPLVADLLTRHRPAVLVLVAHLRLFRHPSSDPTAQATTRNDLASLIPLRELGHAALLPFETRGLTIPRLVLARVLRWEPVETGFYVVDGARAQYGEATIPWLGPRTSTHPMLGLRSLGAALGASNVAITPDHPTVRMMGATVRLARDAGVRVIVVGSPIPFQAMGGTAVGYDPVVYAERFATLRSAVVDAGGVFVDLHDALTAEMFSDPVGHFTADGAKVLAARLRPVVVTELAHAHAASRATP
jgi:hypothetical protein